MNGPYWWFNRTDEEDDQDSSREIEAEAEMSELANLGIPGDERE